jgi:hypothetical protein
MRAFAIVLILGALMVAGSCTTPSLRDVNVLPISPTVTKESATRLAIEEVRRRKVQLPSGYETKVSADFISQEAAPTIPVFTVSFFAGRGSLARGVKRLGIYQVGVNRSNGEIQYFFDLLKLTP